MSSTDQIHQQVTNLGAEACAELFAAYGLTLSPPSHVWVASNEPLLCGIVGFVGRSLRGTCLLSGGYAPLQSSCPEGGRLSDWVGELANQLAGRIKTKFLARSVEVALTTPVVLRGVRLEPLPLRHLEPTIFSSADGDIMVWVEVEAATGFQFGSERPGGGAGHAEEGEMLLF